MSGDASGLAVRAVDPDAPGELDLLAALEMRTFADPWTREDLEPLFAAGAAQGYLALDRNGSPLGFALFQLLPGEVELLRIGVAPEARRHGVGRELLAAALARLDATGRPACHLEVRSGNVAARALYERLGFVLTGRRRAYYSNGEDAERYVRAPGPEFG